MLDIYSGEAIFHLGKTRIWALGLEFGVFILFTFF